MSQCTCTKDAQITCIVHPTESSLKERIAELEAENDRYKNGYKGGCWTCESVGELNVKLEAENQRLREAHKSNSHQELKTVEYAERGHRCSYRAAYEAVKQRSQAALLGGG